MTKEYINPHFENWSNTINEMKQAMANNNIVLAESLSAKAAKEFDAYKDDMSRTYKCNNFGLANHVFESVLPSVFKNDKKTVGVFINTIKEDKNLSAQFQFYNAIKNCNNDDIVGYINEALDLVSKNIDLKSVKKSNEKLANIIESKHIIAPQVISEEDMKLFNNCDFILTHKKKISNLNEYTTCLNEISSYIKKNIKPINEEKANVLNMIEEFESKHGNVLTEEEKSFVQEITDWRSDGAKARKEKLFNEMKNQCIAAVAQMLESCSDEEKDDLKAIREEINSKNYCEETLVKDMAKLLELRDVLLDK